MDVRCGACVNRAETWPLCSNVLLRRSQGLCATRWSRRRSVSKHVGSQKCDRTTKSDDTLLMTQTYGPAIQLDAAKRVAAAAIAEARRNAWTMAVAAVDAAGDLVYFEKMDETQTGSVTVSHSKARS